MVQHSWCWHTNAAVLDIVPAFQTMALLLSGLTSCSPLMKWIVLWHAPIFRVNKLYLPKKKTFHTEPFSTRFCNTDFSLSSVLLLCLSFFSCLVLHYLLLEIKVLYWKILKALSTINIWYFINWFIAWVQLSLIVYLRSFVAAFRSTQHEMAAIECN